MKRILILLIAMILLITPYCFNKKVIWHDDIFHGKKVIWHDYTFHGENENWTADYKLHGNVIFIKKSNYMDCKSKHDSVFTVTYKKNLSDLSSVKHLEIKNERSNGCGTLVEEFTDYPPTKKTYTMFSGGRGVGIVSKDEIMKVTITLDDTVQEIELKPSDNNLIQRLPADRFKRIIYYMY